MQLDLDWLEQQGADAVLLEAVYKAFSDIPARLGVAVSGGGDSVALLHLFARWSAQTGHPIEAVTVDHGLRAQSRGEAEGVAALMAERHPEAGLWPTDPTARSRARWLCAEMAAGFSALRGNCPMQLIHVDADFVPSDAVKADLARVETLWNFAREKAVDGPWLFGAYSLADAYYAPVCARIIGYDLPVSEAARAYCQTTIQDPAFQQWRAEGLKTTYDPFPYPPVGQSAPWPV